MPDFTGFIPLGGPMVGAKGTAISLSSATPCPRDYAPRSHVQLGANHKHEPLFRLFPDDIPGDTDALWWQKFLLHYVQGEDQACLFLSKK